MDLPSSYHKHPPRIDLGLCQLIQVLASFQRWNVKPVRPVKLVKPVTVVKPVITHEILWNQWNLWLLWNLWNLWLSWDQWDLWLFTKIHVHWMVVPPTLGRGASGGREGGRAPDPIWTSIYDKYSNSMKINQKGLGKVSLWDRRSARSQRVTLPYSKPLQSASLQALDGKHM